MYSKMIMERFQNPKNAGVLHGANAIGQVGSQTSSEIMKLYLNISSDGKIEEAKFKAFGCAVSIACLDVMCDLLKRKDIETALKITGKDIEKQIGEVPEYKKSCLNLIEEVVRASIQDYFERQSKETKKAIRKAKK